MDTSISRSSQHRVLRVFAAVIHCANALTTMYICLSHSFAHFICQRHSGETMKMKCLPSHTHTHACACDSFSHSSFHFNFEKCESSLCFRYSRLISWANALFHGPSFDEISVALTSAAGTSAHRQCQGAVWNSMAFETPLKAHFQYFYSLPGFFSIN